jgi:hypothetical protein
MFRNTPISVALNSMLIVRIAEQIENSRTVGSDSACTISRVSCVGPCASSSMLSLLRRLHARELLFDRSDDEGPNLGVGLDVIEPQAAGEVPSGMRVASWTDGSSKGRGESGPNSALIPAPSKAQFG